eukprot:COSAG02_NODE_3761_length_6272_cov_5.833468_4_plen_915_part_00
MLAAKKAAEQRTKKRCVAHHENEAKKRAGRWCAAHWAQHGEQPGALATKIMEVPVESHQPSDFSVGLVVELIEEPGTQGTVLKREGLRVRVDFSATGGRSNGEWRSYKELAVVDMLNLSGASDPFSWTSDDEPCPLSSLDDLKVIAMSDVANARFCKKCDAEHAVFELLPPDGTCAGSHPNFHYSKTIPDGFRVVAKAADRPLCGRRTTLCSRGQCGGLGTVAEDEEPKAPDDPDMNRGGARSCGEASSSPTTDAPSWFARWLAICVGTGELTEPLLGTAHSQAQALAAEQAEAAQPAEQEAEEASLTTEKVEHERLAAEQAEVEQRYKLCEVFHRVGGLAGNDLESGLYTLSEAFVRCSALPNCLGFTYRGQPGQQGELMCYFKNCCAVRTDDSQWQSYKLKAKVEQPVADGRSLRGGAAHSDVVVKRSQQRGGQTVREYQDGRREVIFPSGQRQITHRDGTEETVFDDGQRQIKYPDGKKVTVQVDGTTHTTFPDGTEVTVFADDGTVRKDGWYTANEETTFPDGRVKILWSNGNVDVTYPTRLGGRKETVLPSGEKQTTFPNGTTEVVTAKGLCIPAVLQPSRSPCSSDYHDCDSRAQQAKGGRHWRSVQQLAEHLAEPFRGDAEKVARVMFRWIASNIAYDVERLRQEDSTGLPRGDSQTAETVMRTGLAVCAGYSTLMCALCDAVGVPCKYIGGDARGGEDDREPDSHGWNALSFDGSKSWHLCDVCWAAGSCTSGGSGATLSRQTSTDTLARASSRGFTRRFAKEWWCTAPRHFVERHLPEDPGDQMLERPVSKANWMRMRDTTWTPTTFATMNDSDEVLAPSTGVLRRGQRVEFRIFLAEDTPSALRLQWNDESMPRFGTTDADALRAERERGGYVHSVTVQARSGRVGVYKEGSSSYHGLAEWKVD